MRRTIARVVVNADDLGLHRAVNLGIYQAHQEGIVTSVSLMACGRAFDDALEKLNSCPELGVGIHLTLVGEIPVSPLDKVSSLVGREGFMPESYREFARGWLLGRIREEDVRYELESQVRRIMEAGVRPTHLDSHQHVHCLPGVWKITIDLAKKYQIPFVRLPDFESLWVSVQSFSESFFRGGVNVLARIYRSCWTDSIRVTDYVRGLHFSGQMTRSRLLKILATIRPGLTEIVVHPGIADEDLRRRYNMWRGFDWETELRALTDQQVRDQCYRGNFHLTNFAATE